MRTGLLQPSNSNFVGITRRKFAAIGYRFPLSPVFGQWNKLLERLNIRKPPAEFQDVCLKTFCAVRARLRLEDFNGEGQAICCARGFHYESWFSFPASQVSESEGGTGSGSFLVFCCPTSLDFLFSRCSVSQDLDRKAAAWPEAGLGFGVCWYWNELCTCSNCKLLTWQSMDWRSGCYGQECDVRVCAQLSFAQIVWCYLHFLNRLWAWFDARWTGDETMDCLQMPSTQNSCLVKMLIRCWS